MTTAPEQPDRDAALQGIVDRLAGRHEGGDPEKIAVLLEQEMSAAGLSTGAPKWIRDTADEIAGGRAVVVDTRQQHPEPGAT